MTRKNMIESDYNYYAPSGDKILCLNAISKIVLSLSNDEYDFMKRLMQTPVLQQQYPDLQQRLARGHFLVGSMEDEVDYLRQLYRSVKNNGVWHLIINPTQDCNFRCWYCYEKHPKGHMQSETMERIKKLVRNIFERHEVKHFMLGWFGGEPLMYFNEIVYPLSLYVKQLAAEHGAGFSNSMTSNGFLLTQDVRKKCPEINLNHFQITLDGDREAHNRTRNQKGVPSFDQILDNAMALVEAYPESSIKLRINYNSETIRTDFARVLDVIPHNIRSQFWIQFQRIWQTYEKEGNDIRIKEILQHHSAQLKKAGFHMAFNSTYNFFRGILCYADRINYAHINYDGNVYRCTANDYTVDNALGYVDDAGNIVWDEAKTNGWSDKAFFDNPVCLSCKLLPLCGGPCFNKWWHSFRNNPLKECPLKGFKSDMDLETFVREYYDYKTRIPPKRSVD